MRSVHDHARPRRTEIPSWLMPALAVALVIGADYLIRLELAAPVPLPSSPPPVAALAQDDAPGTFPPELVEVAVAVSTFLAPTPTPPPTRAHATSVPTPALPNCAPWLPDGTLCEWPLPVILPTPVPSCATPEPGIECVWRPSTRDAAIDTPLR